MTTAEYYELNKDRIYLFNQGSYQNAYELMGAHPCTEDGQEGTRFTVWVPGAEKVSVMGDFNGWSEEDDQLQTMWDSGIWTLFVPGAAEGQAYKYRIETGNGQILYKADPYGYWSEKRPKSASVIRRLDYEWHDGEWMDRRARSDHFRQPKNIYEVHLGSWKRHSDRPKEEQFYTYSEIAADLVPYAKKMGYTHLEIMPVMEHPLDDSWGYQLTGYYAATSRFGTPQQLMELIDTAHQAGIGIILDWVPAHFCRDDHGLVRFNGEMLYEKTEHPQWGTLVFDYGRLEVKSFLLSNAVFWIEKYHADGLRVDGVSSMLYLNFGIDDPEKKRFNKYGEEGNLEAIDFLQDLARTVGARFPGVFTVAEESTAWPKVTHPADQGGLGFHYKWDMGWMHDTLEYISTDYLFRKYHQNQISFSMMYAHSENFILPLSHDEVVHGKKSIIGRQQGDYQRQFAGLKALAAARTAAASMAAAAIPQPQSPSGVRKKAQPRLQGQPGAVGAGLPGPRIRMDRRGRLGAQRLQLRKVLRKPRVSGDMHNKLRLERLRKLPHRGAPPRKVQSPHQQRGRERRRQDNKIAERAHARKTLVHRTGPAADLRNNT